MKKTAHIKSDIDIEPAYHEVVGLIYDAVNHPDGFYPFMQNFMQVFNCHSSAMTIYDKKRQQAIGGWIANIPDDSVAYFLEHLADKDALMLAAMTVLEKGEKRFVATNLDIDPVKYRQEIDAGEKWLATYGAKWAAGAVSLFNDNYTQFFSVQRAPDQGEFTREELAMFDLFLPHLNRSASLYSDFNNLQVSQLERQALDQMQTGIIICDASFKVAYYNRIAGQLLSDIEGMTLDEAPFLVFIDADFSSRFSGLVVKAMQASLRHKSISDAVLHYEAGGHHMTLVVSPLKAAVDSPQSGGVMISLHDWSSRVVLDAETLKQYFSLTRMEAEIARRLAAGEALAEIADNLNRSRETVRTHLRNLFIKTRTERQGELISLLATVSGRKG